MAIEELTHEPREIRAGDTVKWRVNYDDFPPSDSWTLSYKILSHQNVVNFSASTEDNDYVVTLTSTQSGGLTAEPHDFIGYVTKGAERATVFTGLVNVLPNLVEQIKPFDNRSKAAKILAILEDSYTTFGEKAWTQSYTIGDKAMSFRSPREFMDFYNHIKRQVNRENVQRGLKTNRIVYTIR